MRKRNEIEAELRVQRKDIMRDEGKNKLRAIGIVNARTSDMAYFSILNLDETKRIEKRKRSSHGTIHLLVITIVATIATIRLASATALDGNAEVVGADSSAPWGSTLDLRERTQSTAGEASPEGAGVLTAGQVLVGLDDSITSGEERGTAGLELHGVEDELDHEGVAVLGDRSGLALQRRKVEVVGVAVDALGVGLRREQGVAVRVLLEDALKDDEEDLGPTSVITRSQWYD